MKNITWVAYRPPALTVCQALFSSLSLEALAPTILAQEHNVLSEGLIDVHETALH